MATTEKDVLEIFGIEDLSKYDTPEALKAEVDKKWVTIASAHNNKTVAAAIFGKANRQGRSKIADLSTEFGLDVEIGDDEDIVALIPKIKDALKPKFDEIKTMQEKLKTAAPADVVAEYEGKLKETAKKLTAFEKSAKEWQEKFTGLETEVKTKDKKAKVDGEWNGALSGILFSPQVDDLRKDGFVARMKNEYQVLVDEEGKTYAANAKGEPLMHPKKAAERWTLGEALKAKAEEFKLVGVNPQGGRHVAQPVKREEQTPAVGVRRERVVAPPMR